MDYDELVQKVQELEQEVQNLRDNPSKEAMESTRRSILDREIGTGQFVSEETVFVPEGGGNVQFDKNKLYDTGIIIDLDGNLYVLGAYKYRL